MGKINSSPGGDVKNGDKFRTRICNLGNHHTSNTETSLNPRVLNRPVSPGETWWVKGGGEDNKREKEETSPGFIERALLIC